MASPISLLQASLDGTYIPVHSTGAVSRFTISGEQFKFGNGREFKIIHKTPTCLRREGYNGSYRLVEERLIADNGHSWQREAAPPHNIFMSGATGPCMNGINGVYDLNGSYNGRPSWQKRDKQMWLVWAKGISRWCVTTPECKDENDGSGLAAGPDSALPTYEEAWDVYNETENAWEKQWIIASEAQTFQIEDAEKGGQAPLESYLVDRVPCRRRQRYTLSRLHNSMIAGFLAVYHIYWLFAAMIIGFALGINILLTWYIEWFQYTVGHGVQDLPLWNFSAVFLRSCLLIRLLSNLARITVWLMQDALRLEAFQVYRCMLCFGAVQEFATADPDKHEAIRVLGGDRGWRYTDRCTGAWDLTVQIIIYFSFDILPVIMAVITVFTDSPSGAASDFCIWACGAAVIHVLLFAFFELLNDVWAKVLSWRLLPQARFVLRCRYCSRPRRDQSDLSEANTSSSSFVVDEQEESAASPPSSFPFYTDQSLAEKKNDPLLMSGMEAFDDAPWNVCVLVCSGIQYVGYFVLALLLLAGWLGGIYRLLVARQYDLLVATSVVLLIWMMFQVRHIPRGCARRVAEKAPKEAPKEWSQGWQEFWTWASETQKWGDLHCDLATRHAAPQYEIYAMITCLQIALFWFIGWWRGIWLMLATFIVLVVRRLTLGFIKPFGWLIGLLENIGIVLATIIMNWAVTGGWYALGTFILCVAVQFKCSRQHRKGWRLLIWVTFALHFLLLLIVTVSMQALVQGGGDKWSNFCDGNPGCQYFKTTDAPVRLGNYGYEFCDIKFPLSEPSKKSSANNMFLETEDSLKNTTKGGDLRLPHFAMFSALAYDSVSSFNTSLARWFKGWEIAYQRRVDELNQAEVQGLHNDWTTFFELVDPETNCTVFVIRGTHKPLEILQDINVWAPIAIPQLASFFGPDLTNVAARAVLLLSTAMYGSWMQKNYYSSLLSHVQSRQKADPNRQYYLTGHSLGGGLAKLVSIETKVPAITFSSPGVSATRMLVAKDSKDGEGAEDMLHRMTYTVVPDNDVVPRVDYQLGIQIPISCKDNPLGCHSSGETLCDLVYSCGSKLDHPVDVSCELCPRHAHLFAGCRHVSERNSALTSKRNSADEFEI